MTFHSGTWTQREATLGDPAESVFEAVQTLGFVRFGLNRPPLQVHRLPMQIRYTPDYLRSADLVEVMGCGRDQTLKLKVEKHTSQMVWHETCMPVTMFIWDSHHQRWGEFNLADLAVTLKGVTVKQFHDGKSYYPLPLEGLPIQEWHAYAAP